jgi:threonine-phosphate decarboxylase
MIRPVPLHGGQLQQISERFGVPVSRLLDFSANINPDGPPAAVFSTLRASLDDPSVLTSYPEMEEPALRDALATYTGVSSENIAVASGFVPLLEAALRVLPIQKSLLPVPAFVEYRKVFARSRIEIVPHVLTQESGFLYDVDAMLRGSHDAVLLANPQNPTGVLSDREVLLELTVKAAERNIYILLDEAFIDYCPEESLIHEIDRFPNLIVFRSVTKFFGIPGLRVAYAASTVQTAKALREAHAPWSITTLASRAVSAALADDEYAKRTRTLNQERRTRLKKSLEAVSLCTEPSSANFLLFRLPPFVDAIEFWERMIVDHQIVLRQCGNYEALPDGYLRAAVRNDEDNARLVAALTQALDACMKKTPVEGLTKRKTGLRPGPAEAPQR